MKKLLLFLVILCSYAVAQEHGVYFMQSAEDFFLLGMRQYAQKDYKNAANAFENSIAVSPLNHRITASTIMLAKTHFALKDYLGAAILCDSMLHKYPYSLYVEDAHFTLGMCYYNEGLYVNAVKEMLTVHRIARERLNREHSFKVVDNIASEFLSQGEINTLVASNTDPSMHALLTVISAEKYFSTGNDDNAKAELQNFNDPLPGQPMQQRANRLLARIEKGNLVRIGVLLPLFSGSNGSSFVREKKVSNDILQGIQLALRDYEEHSEPGHITVAVDIKDSRRDSTVIDSVISQWAMDSTITGILGPVFSDETFYAAVAAEHSAVPLVSPTATEEGLSQIGPYVFQANTSISMRGKIMAQYTVNALGAKTIGILASDFPSSKTQADSFAAEVVRLGGSVIIDRRYPKGETDLRFPLREFRSVATALKPDYVVKLRGRMNVANIMSTLLAYGAQYEIVDSILAVGGSIDLTNMFGPRAKEVADSLKLPVILSYPFVDSLQYPVTSIDAIFCPISSSQQIGVISSQVAYFNLRAKIIGTAEWYNIHELEMNRRYADGVIFGSDRWMEKNPKTDEVYNEYLEKYGKQITDNVLFGYDGMSLLIAQLQKGSITREELAVSLASVNNFQGIRNTISLNHGRVNGSLHILQYKNGTISKLVNYAYQ